MHISKRVLMRLASTILFIKTLAFGLIQTVSLIPIEKSIVEATHVTNILSDKFETWL